MGRHGRRPIVALVGLAVLAAGCGAPSSGVGEGGDGFAVSGPSLDDDFNGTLATAMTPPTQTLLDDRGQPVSLADQPEGTVRIVFFGYTHCPDICPTTLVDLAQARASLPANLRDQVTVVFITEDPERDAPQEVRRWLDGFDPSFVGLIGGNAVSEEMLKGLYSSATVRVADPEKAVTHPDTGGTHERHGAYGLAHSAIVYAFGPGGVNLVYTGGYSADQYANDFESLLSAAG